MNRPQSWGQGFIFCRHVCHSPDEACGHRPRAISPTHSHMQWAVIRDLPCRKAIGRAKTEVLREIGENVILLNHLPRKAKAQPIVVCLQQIRQRIDRIGTSAEDHVLPPGVGRQGDRGVAPQAPLGTIRAIEKRKKKAPSKEGHHRANQIGPTLP